MERVAIQSRAIIVKLLENLEKELIAKVADGVTDWSKARIAKQLSEADAIIRQYYDDAAGIARDTTTSVAQVSASATATSLSAAVGGQVAIGVLPTASYLETLASDTIIQGAIQRDWWQHQANNTTFQFQSAVRQGLVSAETTPQIVKRVRGVLDISRRNAETLVHTSVQSVANTSRMKVFEDNSDIISEFEYSSALDRKTCPTCGALDNKRWVNGTNKPVNHSMAFKQPPIHFRCRCSCIPVLKSWRELGINMDELPDGTRASMEGQVNDKTFEDWLKRKTETDLTFADRTLGKGRAELWRNGKITMDQMISSGKPLSLNDLKAKYDKPILKSMDVNKIVDAIEGKIKQSNSIEEIWANPILFNNHIDKRIAFGHISSKDDYLHKIKKTIIESEQYTIALGGKIELLEIKSKDWSILFNGRGEIKTAYKIEPNMPSFTDNHKRLGYKVYEENISERNKKILRGLFSPS